MRSILTNHNASRLLGAEERFGLRLAQLHPALDLSRPHQTDGRL
jgi:hypothetical protein